VRPLGEERVALGGVAHLGQHQPLRERHRLAVDLAAPDDEDLVTRPGQRQRLGQRVGGLDVRVVPVRLARDDDRAATGQHAPDRLEGLAAHDHGVAHGGVLEVLEVLGEVPRHPAAAADDAVAAEGGEERDAGHATQYAAWSPCAACAQTAIGALIEGWAW
jgi:hypothetical protein